MGRIKKILKRIYFHFSHGIVCHGRCVKNISRQSNIMVLDKLDFSQRFSKKDGNRYEIGRISLAKNSTLIVKKRITFFHGCKLSVSSGATLELSGGGV